MPGNLSIVWFRQDLRLSDNPALMHAVSQGDVLPVYIRDDVNPLRDAMGAAAKWWTHHALQSLDASLQHSLNVYTGDPEETLAQLATRHNAKAVYWNRCYEPWQTARDKRIKARLKLMGFEVQSFNASLLWEPWEILKQDKTPYKVFTPFYYKGCLAAEAPRAPLAAPATFRAIRDDQSLALQSLDFLPRIRWDTRLEPHWDISEAGAQKRLTDFLATGLDGYAVKRDLPGRAHVSRLSPYLHHGQISPHQVWHAVRALGDTPDIDHFCRELGWREFSYNLLSQFPSLPEENWQPKFNHFPWTSDDVSLRRWQTGTTGYPIVDAGMRELWQTGYMHNRVRMIVASFLVKNLLIDWRHGARWFWDCLVDADLANNSASWQWVAGSGADAAPYFRVFNPVTQGEKFDADGAYTRAYVPELSRLPDAYLFKPWEAPDHVLRQSGVALGETYPLPMVEVAASRDRALTAFGEIKSPR